MPRAWIDQAKARCGQLRPHLAWFPVRDRHHAFRGECGLALYFTFTGSGYDAIVFLNDYGIPGADDLGAPDRTAWATATRSLLARTGGCNRNVVMWSWCGEADTTADNITALHSTR